MKRNMMKSSYCHIIWEDECLILHAGNTRASEERESDVMTLTLHR